MKLMKIYNNKINFFKLNVSKTLKHYGPKLIFSLEF